MVYLFQVYETLVKTREKKNKVEFEWFSNNIFKLQGT